MSVTTSAFARLRKLLSGIPSPAETDPIALHLGECRLDLPDAAFSPMASVQDWAYYPPLGGTRTLRQAYSDWLSRRYGVRDAIQESAIGIEPTPGTKQALSVAIALAVAGARTRGVADPAVIVPSPFYPTYPVAAEAAGARCIFYTLPGTQCVREILTTIHLEGHRVAAVVVANPGCVGGEVLPLPMLREVHNATGAVSATLVIDECYSDLGSDSLPPGYLSSIEDDAIPVGPFVVLHSLSKRSGAPGLRSGFIAGDHASVAAYAQFNRSCGVSTSVPICAVASALWADDGHVSRLRARIARNWELAQSLIGEIPHFKRAEAGFFVWLPVTHDEQMTRRLWHQYGLLVMPGRYLSAPDDRRRPAPVQHIRIALVHDEGVMRQALLRLRSAFLSI